ncbi:5-hydroxytryptamine receptor 4-like [Stegostoma tigrinum]|uniref:5-hydroxytryptamine receptor 4-like n=1 Tax=Stegostoma tigrinum TaxID=3053191 RepID=UPI00287085A8|nr:5-hydroxytryptamine receptor 4-like [Stegostoma tigrinum]
MVRPIILQIKDIFYPVLAAFGVPANLLATVILSRGKCGLSKCISVYMLAMVTADLMIMLVNVIVLQVLNKRFPHSFLSYTVVIKLILYMSCTNVYLSVWYTVCFTFDRYVAICCHKLKTKYSTVRTASWVIIIVSVLVYLENIPFWFAYEHQGTINNIQWGFRPSVIFLTSPVGAMYSRLQNVLVTWIPFILILLFNGLTARHIVGSNISRRRLRAQQARCQTDPEMKSRRKSIILLSLVSGSFMLLNMTSAVSSLVNTFAVLDQIHYTSPPYIATETGYLLTHLSSCTNTCIYAMTQTKFRAELQKVLKFPWTHFLTMVNTFDKHDLHETRNANSTSPSLYRRCQTC